jgi:tetrahydromethanopterin S-methyltransferase subunit G
MFALTSVQAQARRDADEARRNAATQADVQKIMDRLDVIERAVQPRIIRVPAELPKAVSSTP